MVGFGQQKEHENQFHWEHKGGKKAITISFHKESRVFLGINTFGIRMRHEFFDKVLSNKKTVDYVMHHLLEANFDPEFFTSYYKEIQQQFTTEYIGLKTE
jgi:hypothetical protein